MEQKTQHEKQVATKYIFVTGGVLSGLGKGVSAASLGRLLKARNYKVFALKFDPYYNVDPGTMNPYQHGEVFVTSDGAETDLDLGHYERFIGEKFTKKSNYVQGGLLKELLAEERAGDYDGKTIQVIPHVTNKIIDKIRQAGSESQADFVIIEIGGTVGDIESLPFISAISQFSRKYQSSSFFIHTTFLPHLATTNDFKSKPTQNSIAQLQSMGIFPNMILLRSNLEIPSEIVEKVATKAFLPKASCIPVPNSDNVYKIPLYFETYEMAQKVLAHFGMRNYAANLNDWKKYVALIDMPKPQKIKIGLIGKYVEFEDAYKSIVEALKISGNWNQVVIEKKWIQSEDITSENIATKIQDVDGVIILPGFGPRGFNGKIIASKYTRDHDIPTLGICFGFQAMVINQALIQNIKQATSSEISTTGTFVIDIIRGKNKDEKRGGTLRLGESETVIKKGSRIFDIYQNTSAFERHRHRYEVNPKFIDKIESDDFIFSGFDRKTQLAEICEMPHKRFYIGLQAHPEFSASPLKEHPLFRAFIRAVTTFQHYRQDEPI